MNCMRQIGAVPTALPGTVYEADWGNVHRVTGFLVLACSVVANGIYLLNERREPQRIL